MKHETNKFTDIVMRKTFHSGAK